MTSRLRAGKRYRLLILTIFQMFFSVLWAQDTLKEAVIYSEKVAERRIYSLLAATVIDQKDLQEMNIRSIDELLRYVPFVDVNSRGMFGSQSDLSIRGTTFNQVLVLVDGMRSGDPLTGHFATYLPVSMAEIELIEILRGPAAAKYGADAVGGVINIITRTNPLLPANLGRAEVIKTSFGSYGFRGLEGGVYEQVQDMNGATWTHNGGMQWNQAKGHPTSDTSNSSFNNITGSYALGYSGRDRKYAAQTRFGWDARAFDARNFYTLSTADRSIEEVRRWMLQHRSIWRLSKERNVEWMANFIQGNDSFRFSPISPANVHQTRFLSSQLSYQFAKIRNHTIHTGLVYERRMIESNDRGNRNDQRIALYGSGLGNWYRLVGQYALRVEYDQNYQWQVLPQISLGYVSRNEGFYRFMAGRSIRGADFTERYINTALPGTLASGRNVGNPALREESFWTAELGYQHNRKHLSLEMNVFYRAGRDLIDYRLRPGSEIIPMVVPRPNLIPSADYLWAFNTRELDVYGTEVFIRWQKTLTEGQHLLLQGAYAYNGLVKQEQDFSKYISNTTKHLGQASIDYRIHRVRLYQQFLLKDRYFTPVPGSTFQFDPFYWQWNAKVSFEMLKHMQVFVEANNLMNRFISDIYGAVLPGRWMIAGMHYTPGLRKNHNTGN